MDPQSPPPTSYAQYLDSLAGEALDPVRSPDGRVSHLRGLLALELTTPLGTYIPVTYAAVLPRAQTVASSTACSRLIPLRCAIFNLHLSESAHKDALGGHVEEEPLKLPARGERVPTCLDAHPRAVYVALEGPGTRGGGRRAEPALWISTVLLIPSRSSAYVRLMNGSYNSPPTRAVYVDIASYSPHEADRVIAGGRGT